jgi:hypothetical protein
LLAAVSRGALRTGGWFLSAFDIVPELVKNGVFDVLWVFLRVFLSDLFGYPGCLSLLVVVDKLAQLLFA